MQAISSNALKSALLGMLLRLISFSFKAFFLICCSETSSVSCPDFLQTLSAGYRSGWREIWTSEVRLSSGQLFWALRGPIPECSSSQWSWFCWEKSKRRWSTPTFKSNRQQSWAGSQCLKVLSSNRISSQVLKKNTQKVDAKASNSRRPPGINDKLFWNEPPPASEFHTKYGVHAGISNWVAYKVMSISMGYIKQYICIN